MDDNKTYTAIGLMSGMSQDGVDVTILKTDGRKQIEFGRHVTIPYTDKERQIIAEAVGERDENEKTRLAETVITDAHIRAVKEFGEKADIIGFHGHTLFHDPYNPDSNKRRTWQIGDSQRLASEVGINVVGDMRYADFYAGGQGAPLLPICHQAFAQTSERPIVILNMGGVSNITYLGETEKDILAGDVGPANALIDDYMKEKTGKLFDKNGELAASGSIHQDLLKKWLSVEFFDKSIPKSLDRNPWNVEEAYNLSLEDGAATITAFTVQAIAGSIQHLPQKLKAIYVGGGGRHNKHIMEELSKTLNLPVEPVEKLGWNGDALEAQGFAYLAARSLKGLALTLPTTTGVPKAMTGGKLYKAK